MRPKAFENNTENTDKGWALHKKLRRTKARDKLHVTQKNHKSKRAVPLKRPEKPTSDRKRAKKSEMWFTGVPSALVRASQDAQDSTAPDLVKMKSFSGPTKRIAMDCEFVGVGFDGKESALARVSIVNQFGHLLMDEYVRPKERITDYRTAVSGITPAHMRPGGPAKDFDSVHQRVAELCKGRILVGHAVHNDLKVSLFTVGEPLVSEKCID
uniref:Exonuclease domain-containing protein n=1 Tax=Schistocephalus solidus TaxID=70667 RepID=A0A0X3PBJ9_SCHSO